MFSRHCMAAHFLEESPELDYILFLDADMGIINPNHLIEEYLDGLNSYDLVFSERIFSNEIMAGTYLAKNTEYTRDFLLYWANSYYSLPKSFHGTDNGAIHTFWARDGWLTENLWSPRDFVIHGWQKSHQDRLTFARWHSPLVPLNVAFENDLTTCTKPDTAKYHWPYKDTFIKSVEHVDNLLNRQVVKAKALHLKNIKDINK